MTRKGLTRQRWKMLARFLSKERGGNSRRMPTYQIVKTKRFPKKLIAVLILPTMWSHLGKDGQVYRFFSRSELDESVSSGF